ncbi:MAG: hypothetical protein WKF41_13905 [Gaiellaceae bacterium]
MGGRLAIVAALLSLGLALPACGASESGIEDHRAEPSRELATPSGWFEHRDTTFGASVSFPDGWRVAEQPLTNLVVPREVLALATYPLRGGNKGGGPCAAKRDLEAMPPDGALIWLLEYRPLRGDVWADVRRSEFPSRPNRVELSRADLEANSCARGFGYTSSFRAADRPLTLSLVFGERVTDERLAEVEAILESLELAELAPPPPDPYAGWPLINDNPGDSLRPPPGWAASAAMFPPGETPRPRTLFFASNRPLFGLPKTLVPHVEQLPPTPSWAVANAFPRDGVLLWVSEDEKGGPAADYAAIEREWPSADDFRPVQILTKPNPELEWLRAAGSFRGYRWSILIGAGPEATEEDRELALKSAASLAVSGVCREDGSDCPE